MTKPDLDSVTLAGSKLTADLTDAITTITVDYSPGSVAQLVVTVTDSEKALAGSPLLRPGTALTWRADPWEVAGRTTTRGADNVMGHQFTCRSTLARKLRRRYKATVEKKVSPSDWVTRRVTAVGGRATCQPSSRQSTIAQMSGSERQSELDVIANLASDLEWSWVEWGNRIIFGSRHWAWQTGPTGRLWAVTWQSNEATDAVSSDVTYDDDDTENYLSGTLQLPYGYGWQIRPWDRIQLTGFGDQATVLAEQVAITADGSTPVTVQFTQPRPPAKKAGSSS
jgi:hypothetical protein